MGNIINHETCTKCYLCLTVCPAKVIGKKENGEIHFIEEKLDICPKCGHCMSVCETKSIIRDTLAYDKDVFEVKDHNINSDNFYDFLATRHSIRHFKNKPVPKELLQKILDFVSLAPFGVAANNIEINVIQNREKIEEALPIIRESLTNIGKWVKQPISNFFIKHAVDEETYNTIIHHLVPMIEKEKYNQAEDTITRNAPALLIFHANKGSEEHTHDSWICTTYAFMAAHALGLGATIIGLIPPPVNKSKALKKIFQIPEHNEVVSALILGYPKYHYKRGIQHKRTKIHWLE